MLLSQRPDPREKTSHNPWSKCACVWIFRWIVYQLLFVNHSSPLSFFRHGRSLSFEILGPWCVQLLFLIMSNFYFFIMLFWACLSFLFELPMSFFLGIITWRGLSWITWSFILWDNMDGWVKCSCATSSVEIGKYVWSVRGLDHESMKCISQRVTTIWQKSMR